MASTVGPLDEESWVGEDHEDEKESVGKRNNIEIMISSLGKAEESICMNTKAFGTFQWMV